MTKNTTRLIRSIAVCILVSITFATACVETREPDCTPACGWDQCCLNQTCTTCPHDAPDHDGIDGGAAPLAARSR